MFKPSIDGNDISGVELLRGEGGRIAIEGPAAEGLQEQAECAACGHEWDREDTPYGVDTYGRRDGVDLTDSDLGPYDTEDEAKDFAAAEVGVPYAIRRICPECGSFDIHHPERDPEDWLNSAAIKVDPSDDSVTLSVSVFDPRGAFTLTIRRRPDGRLLMHVPYPGEGFAHGPLTPIHFGTYGVGHGWEKEQAKQVAEVTERLRVVGRALDYCGDLRDRPVLERLRNDLLTERGLLGLREAVR